MNTLECEDCHTWASTCDPETARKGLFRHWLHDCPERKPLIQRRQYYTTGAPVALLRTKAAVFRAGNAFEVMAWLKAEGIDSFTDVASNLLPQFQNRLHIHRKDHSMGPVAKEGDYIVKNLDEEFCVVSSEDFGAALVRWET